MKKVVSLMLSICLFIVILTGCGKKTRTDGVWINVFISSYASYGVEEDYYESHDLDFHYLYDVEMSDAESSGSSYRFPLTVSVFGSHTAEMKVLVDENDYVRSVFVTLKDSALNLFETRESLIEYYVSIITSLNTGLSGDMVWGSVEELLDQGGEERRVDINNDLVLCLQKTRNGLLFQVALNN